MGILPLIYESISIVLDSHCYNSWWFPGVCVRACVCVRECFLTSTTADDSETFARLNTFACNAHTIKHSLARNTPINFLVPKNWIIDLINACRRHYELFRNECDSDSAPNSLCDSLRMFRLLSAPFLFRSANRKSYNFVWGCNLIHSHAHPIHIQNCKYFTSIELQEFHLKKFFFGKMEATLRTMNMLVRYIVIIKRSFAWRRMCRQKSSYAMLSVCQTGAKTI